MLHKESDEFYFFQIFDSHHFRNCKVNFFGKSLFTKFLPQLGLRIKQA